MDPKKVEFLPLGFDDFYGEETVQETMWQRLLKAVENAVKPTLDKLEKWTKEKKKESEVKIKLLEEELALAEAELSLEEAIEDMDEELKMQEKEEEEEKAEIDLQEKEDGSVSPDQDQKPVAAEEEEAEEEEDDEDDDVTPSSFGSVGQVESSTKNDQQGKRPGETPFSSCSLSFASSSLLSAVSFIPKNFLIDYFLDRNV